QSPRRAAPGRGRGGLGYGGGFGRVASEKIPPSLHVAADRRRQNHSHNDGSGDPDEPLLAFHPGFHGYPVWRIQRTHQPPATAHQERTMGQYSTMRGQAVPQNRTTVGTAIKIVRAVMTTFSQRVVAVCRSVAACCLSIATRRRSTASDH